MIAEWVEDQVRVGGLSEDRLIALLERRLPLPANPEATACLRRRPYYLLGEVVHPGTYPYEPDLTVMDAVVAAGGFTHRAYRQWIHIKRSGAREEIAVRLDPDLLVSPGDVIRVERGAL